ncbi:MAG: hypothetical protein AABX11_01080 [Nanoarchaeota archaeon]
MGKNSVIKNLGKRIGNVVLHKLLIKHTNRPESTSHLQNEEIEYRDSAMKDAKSYHWNEEDKQIMKLQALEFIEKKKDKKYFDVIFSLNEAEKFVDEEIINLKL